MLWQAAWLCHVTLAGKYMLLASLTKLFERSRKRAIDVLLALLPSIYDYLSGMMSLSPRQSAKPVCQPCDPGTTGSFELRERRAKAKPDNKLPHPSKSPLGHMPTPPFANGEQATFSKASRRALRKGRRRQGQPRRFGDPCREVLRCG